MKRFIVLIAGFALLFASANACNADSVNGDLTGVVTSIQNTFQGPTFDTGAFVGASISANFSANNGHGNADGSASFDITLFTFSIPASNSFILGPGRLFTDVGFQGNITVFPGGWGTNGDTLNAFGFPGTLHLDYGTFDVASNTIHFTIFEDVFVGQGGDVTESLARVDLEGSLAHLSVPDRGSSLLLFAFGLAAIILVRRGSQLHASHGLVPNG